MPKRKPKKKVKKGVFVNTAKAILEWLRLCIENNTPVSGKILRNKALIFGKKLGIDSFKVSKV
ncbi:hypothetical protein A3Q56_08274 [Intoshia linei]|uniref:HTH CENPB-type domain-containing protein n=1 Tax=Intoshia linei TaxID=1819745 RepID=A0A177APV8_9BILA|nr:hypothetical protein A3Q56_08274 [Intoshia linei]